MILCCGEALIDMVPTRSDAGESAFVPRAGGAGLNAAIALGRLGVPVSLFAGISRDQFGESLLETLRASEVNVSRVLMASRPTTLAFAHVVDRKATYSFHDEYSAGRMLIEADLPALDSTISTLLFTGISLVCEPCGSTFETLLRRSHHAHVTMLDPNIRPAFIGEREAHLVRMRRMIGMADIVKLSDDDLAWFGEAGELDAIACRWLKAGPSLLVVTRGERGAIAYTSRSKVEAPVPNVSVADTIGAGDTASAALLAWLHEAGMLTKEAIGSLGGNDLRAALAFSMRVAGTSVTRAGANPPWRHELT